MSTGPSQRQEDSFGEPFEAAFLQLEDRVRTASATESEWPRQVAAAVRAVLDFAAADPDSARLLITEARSAGDSHHQRLLRLLAALLRPGRKLRPTGPALSLSTERATAAGFVSLLAERLDAGRPADLPDLVPAAIRFVLAPYLGSAQAAELAEPRLPGPGR